MNQYLQLFKSFAKIGSFTIGGGYAMIPLIKTEVVDKRKWVKDTEFLDYLAISQSAPGILAINISIFIGEKVKGTKGSIVAALGSALPSFVIILLIALFFESFKENQLVVRIFSGIRPAVVALIAVPLISLSRSAKLNKYTSLIPVISVLLIVLLGISPIWVILAGAMLGIFHYYFSKSRLNKLKKENEE
ncbi:MAG: chromate transporter [Bacteroidia bacterium]|jgi:chromate transporter|nr:chromate transporter [Bacteroidales bacterium]NCC47264.1 chromate transporter [Bacteroidia bacterium]